MTLADLSNRPRAVARVAERLDAEAEPVRSDRAGRLERAGAGQQIPEGVPWMDRDEVHDGEGHG